VACEVAESRLLERFEEEWRGITPDGLVLGDDGGGESGEGEGGGGRGSISMMIGGSGGEAA